MTLAGCGNDAVRLNSGVAGDKTLSQLTESELAQICDATLRYGERITSPARVARAQCVVSGLGEGELQACKVTSAACLSSIGSSSDEDAAAGSDLFGSSDDVDFGSGGPASCTFPESLVSCGARVDALEACLEAGLVKASMLLDQISCDLLTNGADFAARAAAVPGACEALDRSCPGLGTELSSFDDEGEDDGVSPGVPPMTVDATCPALALQFDGQSCSSDTQCQPVSCTCGKSQPISFTHCNSFRGCMSGVACDVVCADTTIIRSKVSSCAKSTACQSDEECGEHRCAISDIAGSCTRGEVGDDCEEDADCSSGKCKVLYGSQKVCARWGTTDSECSRDDECQSGSCYRGDYSEPGRCTDGMAGAACDDDEQCVSGTCVEPDYFGGVCTDRGVGSTCESPSHCDSGFCVYEGADSAVCRAGEVGDLCDDENDCSSGFCVGTNLEADPSKCREGAAGDPCLTFTDCVSQRCILDDDEDVGACGYSPGAQCPDGVADCDGLCSAPQGSCGADDCSPRCGGATCTGQTLATWNFDDKYGSITLSGGDLVATSSTYDDGVVRATLGKSTGKWYWEITVTSDEYADAVIGVANAGPDLDWGLGGADLPGLAFDADGYIYTSSNEGEGGVCGYSEGDVVGVALDASQSRIYFSVNGAWLAGSDPASSTGGRPTALSATNHYPAVSPNGAVLTANFGQTAFKHPPPTGYSALY